MVTVTFLQLKLSSVATDMFVNVFIESVFTEGFVVMVTVIFSQLMLGSSGYVCVGVEFRRLTAVS